MANLTDALQNSAADFIEFYKDHPSYKEAVFKLKQAMFEVDLLTMSPGRREARAAGQPNMAGQEVHDGASEASLESQ